MVTLNNIQSGISSVIGSISDLSGVVASLQGQVIEYNAQLNIDLSKDIIKANALYFENNFPTENLTIHLNVDGSNFLQDQYLTRLENAFTSARKVLTVCFNQ